LNFSPAVHFALSVGRIARHCDGFSPSSNRAHVSPGCVIYTAANGNTVVYFMTKTGEGWRIVEIGTRST
jgi:hypothetical protein